jgi:hypothetical protein
LIARITASRILHGKTRLFTSSKEVLILIRVVIIMSMSVSAMAITLQIS